MTSLIIFTVTLMIGTVVWGIRLEGRVNTEETVSKLRTDDLKELINTRFNSSDNRLERIERALNGYLKKD